MNIQNANALRADYIKKLADFFSGEDVDLITSNTINFPIVAPDGEEGWVEITVKIPKEDDGYDKREEYQLKLKEKEEKAKEAERKKAEKIAAEKAKREAKKAKKEEQ